MARYTTYCAQVQGLLCKGLASAGPRQPPLCAGARTGLPALYAGLPSDLDPKDSLAAMLQHGPARPSAIL